MAGNSLTDDGVIFSTYSNSTESVTPMDFEEPELFRNLTESELAFGRLNTVIYYSIMIPVAIVGNTLTLSAVFMVLRTKKSVPNMLIGVLSLADLFSIFMCHLLSIISMAYGTSVGGDNLCRFQSIMMFSYFKMGFFTKTCISIDRLIALKFPLKYRSVVTMKRIVGVCIFNAFFSIGSSAMTWIIDGKYIAELKTWHMCTNEFYYFTHYKLAIVILEGTVFLIGAALFIFGNITVVKVMLEISKKLKKLKAEQKGVLKGGALRKLGLETFSAVTTASAGFTNIKSIDEEDEDRQHNHTNNNGESDTDSVPELSTPLSSRAIKKINSAEQDLDSEKSKTEPTLVAISLPESHGNLEQKWSKKKHSTASLPPIRGMNGEHNSIVRKVVEKTTKATASKMQSRQKKELQFAKLVMVIVTVFVILWIPYMVSV